jgi:hypothetical protein
MNAFKKLLAVVAAITMWATIQPSTASAQSSGIGGDAWTRLLWTATDSHISLWKVDPVLNNAVSHEYGPYDGYSPIAITTTNNNNTCVLWKRTDGAISLWTVDANLNYTGSTVFGPYYGWTVQSLSPDTNGNNWIRVIWRETEGSVSIWELSNCQTYVRSQVYGPFFGFVPGANATKGSASGPANTTAAAAMSTTARSPFPFPTK